MKLAIAKPITEHDHSNADEPPTPDWRHRNRTQAGRNPDFTDSGFIPANEPLPALLVPIADSGNGDSAVEHEIKRMYLDDCRLEGMIPGATVVHKRVPKPHRLNVHRWGIIAEYVDLKQINGKWKPIRVQWLNSGVEDCECDDLIVLNYVPDKQELKGRADADRAPNPL